jgi:AcrR family transcriptional regulator
MPASIRWFEKTRCCSVIAYDPAVPRSQQERSETTKAAVIQAARSIFASRGYEAASIDEITKAAGISKGALYHHYRDKTEILAAAYEDLERELTDRVATVASKHRDPIKSLRSGCHAFVDACADSDTRRLALIDAPAGLGWHRWREIDAQYGFGLLRFGLQAAADAGRIRKDRIDARAHFLLAMMMEGALLIAAADNPVAVSRDVAKLIDEYIDAMIAT